MKPLTLLIAASLFTGYLWRNEAQGTHKAGYWYYTSRGELRHSRFVSPVFWELK